MAPAGARSTRQIPAAAPGRVVTAPGYGQALFHGEETRDKGQGGRKEIQGTVTTSDERGGGRGTGRVGGGA
jgi:hypothetical protein